ncbi:N-acetylmuramoyl-L-alanine amidase [Hoeflea marina]|uniref:N-acetylmuramoyl-L-alanine amidase n=1 Tax=Hoeflea marina TaxID=274592 RepID=A0A317PRE8_9HYPH|nr:N-acetylmuramoyl-L-alanine amidase [Hoeflea marina]PWW03527.1 N-acetylmuramoyl-L-alanine amidase [Hoeflea marina]
MKGNAARMGMTVSGREKARRGTRTWNAPRLPSAARGIVLAVLVLASAAFVFVPGADAQVLQPAIEPAPTAAAPRPGPLVAFSARVAGDDQRTRLVMEFEAKPDFQVRYLDGPDRIVIELPETAFGFPPAELDPRGLFKLIRFGSAGEGRSRLVLGLARPAQLDLAQSQPAEGGAGFRMVLDAVAVAPDTFAGLVAKTDWVRGAARGGRLAPATDKQFTVVIDAGHGGIDGGAEGIDGVQEKDVTLAFAAALDEKLKAIGGIRVLMTRSDDSFLSLSGRVQFARDSRADLLISLHADSIAMRSLRGATVYTLSDKASDSVAASLVEQEDRHDALVGADLDGKTDLVAGILIDLARSETRVFSNGLAGKVVSSFEGQVKLINNPHRQAGFRVLQAPDVPSVLIELGYLSNRDDEKLLTDPEWRDHTAGLLAQSVKDFRETILEAVR